MAWCYDFWKKWHSIYHLQELPSDQWYCGKTQLLQGECNSGPADISQIDWWLLRKYLSPFLLGLKKISSPFLLWDWSSLPKSPKVSTICWICIQSTHRIWYIERHGVLCGAILGHFKISLYLGSFILTKWGYFNFHAVSDGHFFCKLVVSCI